MKLLLLTVAITLMVLICAPTETEAVAPFFAAFARIGYKLIKRSYYARCNPRYVQWLWSEADLFNFRHDCKQHVFFTIQEHARNI